jgi:acyl-CoA thioester hydrolase
VPVTGDATAAFSMPIVPRYAEIDQQGVVFNGRYLTSFDEAGTAFLSTISGWLIPT